MIRDYSASSTAGNFTKVIEEQDIEQTIKTFSCTTLSGVVSIEHWLDRSDQTHYVLARLDLDNFRNSIEKAKSLNASVRDFVKNNAEKAFEALEKEEVKRQ